MPTATTDQRHDPGWGRLAAVVLGLAVVITLMLLAFAGPGVNSGAKDLPLAVGGPPAAAAKVTQALEAKSPGSFDTSTYADGAQVADAVKKRDAIGGVAVTPQGTTIYTASAAGAPYGNVLRGIGTGLEKQGQKVTYVDVAPWTKDDPMGAGLTAFALPLAFGGMIPAVILVNFFRRSTAKRVLGAMAFSLVAGLVTTAVLQYGFGALDGSYLLTASGVTLGIAAISLAILGLESMFGYPGFALGAVTIMFISNPLSGMAAGPQWLPQPWGEIGQLLPLGAAGTVLRSAAFFDGHGAARELFVLGIWAAVGLALCLLAAARRRGRSVDTEETVDA